MDKSREILKKYWGFDKFRSLQEDIVDDVIYGHDTLALLPTGGGKSICFQVPGIAREGVTIVISPLIALMQDQVNNLVSKGIRAKAIISGMSYREIDITLDNARFGGLDFLYTSPERILSKVFIERFKGMEVGLIVVDEAHCISEWGHDFRPSFKEIFKLREIHPEIPIVALSIVYCQTRKSVKDVARLLHANKISVGIYHGGMTKADRDLMLNDWLSNKITVMVATNAFGMGIDKPDVRYVLHYEFPPSLEAYFQEAGRAGRDGNESQTIVFWEQKDIEILRERFLSQFPGITVVKLIYRAVCNYLKIAIGSGKDETYHFEIRKLCDSFQLDPMETYNSLKILELNGDLTFSEGVFHPTKVKFAVGNRELYNFQIQHPKFVGITTLMSRSYPGIFDNYFEIREIEFAARLKLTDKDVKDQLKELEKYGIIDVSWSSSLPSVTLTHERLPDDYLELSEVAYRRRKENAEIKLNAALSYLTSNECRSVQLLRYFGQISGKCGKCDVCQSETFTVYSISELKRMLPSILTQLNTFEDCLEKTNADEEVLKAALRELILEERIVKLDGKFQAR